MCYIFGAEVLTGFWFRFLPLLSLVNTENEQCYIRQIDLESEANT